MRFFVIQYNMLGQVNQDKLAIVRRQYGRASLYQTEFLSYVFAVFIININPFSPRHYLPYFPREKMSFLPGYA